MERRDAALGVQVLQSNYSFGITVEIWSKIELVKEASAVRSCRHERGSRRHIQKSS